MAKRVSTTSIHDMHACDYESNEYLCINSCGSQVHDRDYSVISRPEGRLDYHMLFITSGYCVAHIGSADITVNKGDMLFYRPHEPQRYTFGDSRCASFWLHLSGTGVADMCSRAGLLSGNVFHLEDLSAIETAHMKLIVENQSKQRGYMQFVQSYVELIFAHIHRQLPVSEQPDDTIADERIAKALNVMDRIYYTPFNIDEYARMCGVGRDRFMHLFRDIVGVPPQKYITGVRIKNAKRMLTDKDMSIAEIAERCGFSDAMYFSRVFRKQTGLSPSEFRRVYGKEER